jgi:hypothetical protein
MIDRRENRKIWKDRREKKRYDTESKMYKPTRSYTRRLGNHVNSPSRMKGRISAKKDKCEKGK